MKVNFDIKKSVIVKTVILILLGFTFGLVIGGTPVDTSKPWHFLNQIADPNGNSVDGDNNGVIDFAETTQCVSADTGYVSPNLATGLGNVVWVGDMTINLKIGTKNICQDTNGCSLSVIEYFAPLVFVAGGSQTNSEDPNRVFDYFVYQSNTPSVNLGGGGPIQPWGADNGLRGFNGDGGVSQVIPNIGGGPISFVLDDDLFGAGTTVNDQSPDFWSLRDFSPTTAYRVIVCD
ncbi:MAG: hypothetical protein NUV97_02020 [archaeon]|nr:hypothetical protein [archaeon]MCR4323728.1 hypothetical protein [Nanoarchaeota archaeon]